MKKKNLHVLVACEESQAVTKAFLDLNKSSLPFNIEAYSCDLLPSSGGFKDRHFNGHLCRVSEGMYGGFFGWPNLTLTPTKEFMGINVTKKSCEMRVIDMYRRKEEKLTENWIFIDFLHFWKMQGIDILGNI